MRATVFLLRRGGTRRPAVECAAGPVFEGLLEADFGHERWGPRSLTATLMSEEGDALLLAELHKAHLTAAGPSGLVLSGMEEKFGRSRKDTLVERQSWAVSLRDVPLSLMSLRQHGRRLTAAECMGRRHAEGALILDRRRLTGLTAIFYDPHQAIELARIQSVALRRINRKGIVLRGFEDVRGARQRDGKLQPQAWWLIPYERPVPAESDDELEDKYEMAMA